MVCCFTNYFLVQKVTRLLLYLRVAFDSFVLQFNVVYYTVLFVLYYIVIMTQAPTVLKKN